MKDSREHIPAIALKLFFQKGYKEVTMSELVKESGLSKGAFYHYFSSKEELYTHSMEMFLSHYMDNFAIEFNEELSLRDNLKALYHQFTPISSQMNTSTQEAANALSNYLIFLQNLMRKPEFRKKIEEYNLNFYKVFAEWFNTSQKRGEIKRDLNPLTLAQRLTGLMKGIGVLYAFVYQSELAEVIFNRIIDQFFDPIEL